MSAAEIRRLADLFSITRKVAVMSGAGLSAESGVPTFRGAEGLWRNHDPIQLATPEAFRANPKLVWEFYNWRREKVMSVQPNPAHYALVDIEQQVPEFVHITQNVDGLSARAGGKNIIELHGNLMRTFCSSCRLDHPEQSGIVPFPIYCRQCGALLRPGVVWFNEPVTRLQEAIDAMAGCDLFFTIGTSAVVQPAASLAVLAKQQGAFVAEFNLEPTPLTRRADLFIGGPAGKVLPALITEAFSV